MIEVIEDMPPGTLGFRAAGDVDAAEYARILLPPLRATIERGDRIRLLFQIGPDLDEIEPGALLEDAKAAFDLGLRHHASWHRTALVTDVAWARRGAQLLGWMAPGELRLFGVAEITPAKRWIAA